MTEAFDWLEKAKKILSDLEQFRLSESGLTERPYNWLCGIETELSNLILTEVEYRRMNRDRSLH